MLMEKIINLRDMMLSYIFKEKALLSHWIRMWMQMKKSGKSPDIHVASFAKKFKGLVFDG